MMFSQVMKKELTNNLIYNFVDGAKEVNLYKIKLLEILTKRRSQTFYRSPLCDKCCRRGNIVNQLGKHDFPCG